MCAGKLVAGLLRGFGFPPCLGFLHRREDVVLVVPAISGGGSYELSALLGLGFIGAHSRAVVRNLDKGSKPDLAQGGQRVRLGDPFLLADHEPTGFNPSRSTRQYLFGLAELA